MNSLSASAWLSHIQVEPGTVAWTCMHRLGRSTWHFPCSANVLPSARGTVLHAQRSLVWFLVRSLNF
jgi:hypothetical protein